MFDPNQFLEQQVDQAMDTVIIPVPEGEYLAVAKEIKARPWTSKDGLSAGVALDIVWDLELPAEVQATIGRDKATLKQGIMLDLSEDGRSLDLGKGKNVALGRLREAIGKNKPGVPFGFGEIPGQACKVLVKHRLDDKGATNPDGSPVKYSEVRGNAKPY